ncbi:MAG: CBS domain-containing protein [Candidatus Micrarchaeota archaeon]|nr:CBS domain-containing protein [Candidatus Micrarchaeota archaeon]
MIFPDLKNIKTIRKRQNLTQKELAKICNVSQSTIAKIERGKIVPSYNIAVAIFNALFFNRRKNKEDTKTAYDIMTKSVISALPNESLNNCIIKMTKNNISQMPVMNESGIVLGSITEELLLDIASKNIDVENTKAVEVCDEAFPIIPPKTDIKAIIELLKFNKALLVGSRGKVVGIITKADVFKSYDG